MTCILSKSKKLHLKTFKVCPPIKMDNKIYYQVAREKIKFLLLDMQ